MSARNCVTLRLPFLYCCGDHVWENENIGHSGSRSVLLANSIRNDADTAISHAPRLCPILFVALITAFMLTWADVAATGATAAAMAVAVGTPRGGGIVAGGVEAATCAALCPAFAPAAATAALRGDAGTPSVAGIGSLSSVLIGTNKPSDTCAQVTLGQLV